MNLLLWRHAEAADTAPDLQRALTGKGRRQAQRMATWLAAHLPREHRVISSEARRARQTARALSDRYEVAAEINPGADARAILKAVGWPSADTRTVVIVGHQPALGEAAALAVTGRATAWRLRKGAVIWIETRDDGLPGRGTLRAILSPDLT